MTRLDYIRIVAMLLLLAGCAPNEPRWIISGDVGTTSQWTGRLPDMNGAVITRAHLHVTRLLPPSPNSGSRQLSLSLNCTGPAASQVRWHLEPNESALPGQSADLACHESTALYATYEQADRQVALELPIGVTTTVEYTLTVTVHSPY